MESTDYTPPGDEFEQAPAWGMMPQSYAYMQHPGMHPMQHYAAASQAPYAHMWAAQMAPYGVQGGHPYYANLMPGFPTLPNEAVADGITAPVSTGLPVTAQPAIAPEYEAGYVLHGSMLR